MQITLKLYAALGRFLPSGASRNAVQLAVEEGISVDRILTDNNVPREMCHLILVNGHYTAPQNAQNKIVQDGDVVAVWPPVAGG